MASYRSPVLPKKKSPKFPLEENPGDPIKVISLLQLLRGTSNKMPLFDQDQKNSVLVQGKSQFFLCNSLTPYYQHISNLTLWELWRGNYKGKKKNVKFYSGNTTAYMTFPYFFIETIVRFLLLLCCGFLISSIVFFLYLP